MKLSKKSKILALTLSAAMLISAFTFSVSAATITVPSGSQISLTSDGDIVTVSVPYSLDTDGQQATILATVGTTADITYGTDPTIPTNIVYIDQETEDGTFTFSFDKSKWASTDFLYIKLGGTDVSTPFTSAGIVFKDNVAIVFGDVNGDGNVTAMDASLVLQKVANIITAFPGNATAADVNADGSVSAMDASLILQRVANIITIFPAEVK